MYMYMYMCRGQNNCPRQQRVEHQDVKESDEVSPQFDDRQRSMKVAIPNAESMIEDLDPGGVVEIHVSQYRRIVCPSSRCAERSKGICVMSHQIDPTT